MTSNEADVSLLYIMDTYWPATARLHARRIVRFVNPTTRLVLLRVPREFCNMVRCSITMLTRNIADDAAAIAATTSKDDEITGSTTTRRALAQLDRRPTLVASVISVNGSARTAKLSTMARIRKVYRQRILENNRDPKVVEELHSLLSLAQNIDWRDLESNGG